MGLGGELSNAIKKKRNGKNNDRKKLKKEELGAGRKNSPKDLSSSKDSGSGSLGSSLRENLNNTKTGGKTQTPTRLPSASSPTGSQSLASGVSSALGGRGTGSSVPVPRPYSGKSNYLGPYTAENTVPRTLGEIAGTIPQVNTDNWVSAGSRFGQQSGWSVLAQSAARAIDQTSGTLDVLGLLNTAPAQININNYGVALDESAAQDGTGGAGIGDQALLGMAVYANQGSTALPEGMQRAAGANKAPDMSVYEDEDAFNQDADMIEEWLQKDGLKQFRETGSLSVDENTDAGKAVGRMAQAWGMSEDQILDWYMNADRYGGRPYYSGDSDKDWSTGFEGGVSSYGDAYSLLAREDFDTLVDIARKNGDTSGSGYLRSMYHTDVARAEAVIEGYTGMTEEQAAEHGLTRDQWIDQAVEVHGQLGETYDAFIQQMAAENGFDASLDLEGVKLFTEAFENFRAEMNRAEERRANIQDTWGWVFDDPLYAEGGSREPAIKAGEAKNPDDMLYRMVMSDDPNEVAALQSNSSRFAYGRDSAWRKSTSMLAEVGIDTGNPNAVRDWRNYNFEYLTPKEQGVFDTLYRSGRKDQAIQFLDAMQEELDYRYQYSAMEAMSRYSTENVGTGALATGLSFVYNAENNIQGLANLLHVVLNGGAEGMSPYDPSFNPGKLSQSIRGAISGELKNYLKVGPFNAGTLYNAVASTVDSLLGFYGVGKLYSVFMGAGAFNNELSTQLEKNPDVKKALISAAASGIVETVTEYASLDKLAKPTGDIYYDVILQSAIEMSEEFNASALNRWCSAWINGGVDDVQNSAYLKILQGQTDVLQAYAEADGEWWFQALEEALTGFLSGGMSSGGNAATTHIQQSAADVRAGLSIYESGNLEEVIQLGEASQNAETRELAGKLRQMYGVRGESDSIARDAARMAGRLSDQVQSEQRGQQGTQSTQSTQDVRQDEYTDAEQEAPQDELVDVEQEEAQNDIDLVEVEDRGLAEQRALEAWQNSAEQATKEQTAWQERAEQRAEEQAPPAPRVQAQPRSNNGRGPVILHRGQTINLTTGEIEDSSTQEEQGRTGSDTELVRNENGQLELKRGRVIIGPAARNSDTHMSRRGSDAPFTAQLRARQRAGEDISAAEWDAAEEQDRRLAQYKADTEQLRQRNQQVADQALELGNRNRQGASKFTINMMRGMGEVKTGVELAQEQAQATQEREAIADQFLNPDGRPVRRLSDLTDEQRQQYYADLSHEDQALRERYLPREGIGARGKAAVQAYQQKYTEMLANLNARYGIDTGTRAEQRAEDQAPPAPVQEETAPVQAQEQAVQEQAPDVEEQAERRAEENAPPAPQTEETAEETAQEEPAAEEEQRDQAQEEPAEEAAEENEQRADQANEEIRDAIEESGEEFSEDVEDALAGEERTQTDQPRQERAQKKRKRGEYAAVGRLYRQLAQELDTEAQGVLAENLSRYVSDMLYDNGYQGTRRSRREMANAVLSAALDPSSISPDVAIAIAHDRAAMTALNDLTGKLVQRSELFRQRAALDTLLTSRPQSAVRGEGGKLQTVHIEGIETGEDGELLFRVRRGGSTSTVKADSIEIGRSEAWAAPLAQYASSFGANADLVFNQYTGGNEGNVNAFINAFREAVHYAQQGRNVESMLKDAGIREVLTEDQARAAYDIGRAQRVLESEKTAEARRSKGRGVKTGNMDITAIHGMIETLTEHQRDTIAALKELAPALRINVRVFASEAVDGRYQGENGSWEESTRTLSIDIHAGANAIEDGLKNGMMNAVGHELTHYIKQFADAALWDDYQTFVISAIAGKDATWLQYKVAELMKNDHTLTEDDAIVEVVADASAQCLQLMSDEDARALAELETLSQYSPNLFERFVDFIKRTAARIRSAIKTAYGSNSRESATYYQAAQLMADQLEEMAAKWNKMLVQAARNANESITQDVLDKVHAQMEAMERGEITAPAETAGADDGAHEAGFTDKELQTLHDVGVGISEDGQSATATDVHQSLRTWNESQYVKTRAKAAKTLSQKMGVTVDEALKFIDDINSIAAIIAGDRVRLDYTSFEAIINPKKGPVSALRENSEYKWTVDISTLCAKRLAFTGTMSAIQARLKDVALDEFDFILIRQMMAERGYTVPCAFCYVESTRKNNGKVIQQFLDKYSAAQQSGEDFVVGTIDKNGKDHRQNFKANTEFEGSIEAFNTPQGFERTLTEFPDVMRAYIAFMNSKGSAKPKLVEMRTAYKGEILKKFAQKRSVLARNAAGGLRLQSFSDFEIVTMIDMMQVVLDMSRVGLMSQAYTKVPAFARIFGSTGIKINCSLVAKDVDANGNIVFDDREGMPHEEAFKAREMHPQNVGTILVAGSDAVLRAAMADPRIDFIIPYHRSSWSGINQAMLGLHDYQDFTLQQNEIDNETGKKTDDPIYPSEYWNKDLDTGEYVDRTGDENAQAYLELCRRRGLTPKFDAYKELPGYWKTLIDFKMYDNDGVSAPQQVVKPAFNMEEAKRFLSEYEQGIGNDALPVAWDVVDDFVAEYRGASNGAVSSSEQTLTQGLEEQGYDVREIKKGKKGGKKAAADVRYSVRDGRLTEDSTEEERYELLKDAKIYATDITSGFREDGSERRSIGDEKQYRGSLSAAKKALWNLATYRLRINRKILNNSDIDIEFKHSNRNIKKSLSLQPDRSGSILHEAKAIANIEDICYTAIPIEVHRDQMADTSKAESQLERVYVMVSAYKEGSLIIPVQLEVKEYKGGPNGLYVYVTMKEMEEYSNQKEEETGLMGTIVTATLNGSENDPNRESTSPVSSFPVSISSIIRNVNSEEDRSFLKYVPDQMLNDEQRAWKKKAIEELRLKRLEYMDKPYMAAVKRGDTAEAQRLVDIVASEAGYDTNYLVWRGDSEEYNTLMQPRYLDDYDGDEGGNLGHGLYFTPVRSYAERFTRNGVLRKFYLNADIADLSDGTVAAEMSQVVDEFVEDTGMEPTNGELFDELLERLEKNAVRARGVGGFSYGAEEIAVQESWQAKLADPVTYDDNGEVIPLSERFNTSNEDIRYSQREDVTQSEAFRRWFGDSKIVNEDGSPMVMYHGTDAYDEFNVFKRGKHGYLGPGIYLSGTMDYAQRYANRMGYNGRVYELYAKVENPLYVTTDTPAQEILKAITGRDSTYQKRAAKQSSGTHILTSTDIRRLQEKGYDGIVWQYGQTPVEVSVFSPEQLKSATNNNGEYDINNPDIRFSDRDPEDITNREILAAALETAAATPEELHRLQNYQKRLGTLRETQQKMEDLQARLTRLRSEGHKDTEEVVRQLITNGKTLQNKIDRIDRTLLNIERMGSIREILDREKAEIREKYQQRMKERVAKAKAEQRQKFDAEMTQRDSRWQERLNAAEEARKAAAARADERVQRTNERWGAALEQQRERTREANLERRAALSGMRAAERRADRAETEQYRARLEKYVREMRDWVTAPSGKHPVPDFLRGPLGDFLESLDWSSRRYQAGGDMTQNDIRTFEAMERMRRAISQLRSQQSDDLDSAAQEFSGYIDLPPAFAEEFDGIVQSMRKSFELGATLTGTPINRMNAEQLKAMTRILQVLNSALRNMNTLVSNSLYQDATDAANATISDLAELGEMRDRGAMAGRVSDFLNWTETTPVYAFKRFGRGGSAIFEGLQNGWDILAHNSADLIEYAKEAYTAQEAREWTRSAQEFTVTDSNGDDHTFQMTAAQVMSLYCLSHRAQAMGHILGGGIKVAEFRQGRRTVSQADNYTLTESDVERITGTLTERQIEVANTLQRYMSTTLSEWGNEVSMQRYGFRMFTEGEYFPIEVDSNNMRAVDEQAHENSLFRLLNMGFTKALVPNANNALVVRDIFEVFSEHGTDMAKYNALALPILDALKWYNYIEKTPGKNGQFTTRSTQKALERAYGGAGKAYIVHLIRDLNGVSEGGRNDSFASRMLSNYKVAAVAANLRVALLQPTSMPRAAYKISPKYLLKAQAGNPVKAARAAREACGIALWKSLGFYDTNISRNVREQVRHEDTAVDRIREASMKLAEWGDAWTLGVIYRAVKAEMRDTQPGLREGSAEYAKHLNDRMREIIYETQVVDSTMTRSDIMRSKGISQLATSFMSEPTLSLNMLNDGIFEYRMNRRAGRGNRQTLLKMARATGAFAVTSLMAALAESLFQAMRDDDDYEEFWKEKFLPSFVGDGSLKSFLASNLGMDFNLLNNIPYVKDIMSMLLQGYDNGTPMTEWLTTASKALTNFGKVTSGESENMTWYSWVYPALQSLSQASGIPISGAVREVTSAYNTFLAGPMHTAKIQSYTDYDSAIAERLYARIRNGDEAGIAWIRERAAANGVDLENKRLRNKLKALINEELERGDIDPDDGEELLRTWAGLTADKAESAVAGVRYHQETDLEWDELADDYIMGRITADEYMQAKMTYGGKSQATAQAEVLHLDYERATGHKWSDLCEDYNAGELSKAEVRQALMTYDGKSEAEADEQIDKYEYAGVHGTQDGHIKAWRLYDAWHDGGNYRAEAQALLDAGMTRDKIASSVAGKIKKEYLPIRGTAAGDAMLEDILDLYESFGYPRDYERDYIARKW